MALKLAEASAALARRTGDALVCSYPELLLGLIHSRRGDLATEQRHYAAALAFGRSSGERIAIIEPLRCMARDADAPLAQRIAWAEEALPLTQELGVPTIAQWLLELLTILYGRAGRLDEAVRALDARFAIAREQGTPAHTHAYALMRGWVALHGSDPGAAKTWYQQGLLEAIADECGFHQWFGLLGLARVSGQQGQHAEAATLLGAAERLRESGFGRSGFVGFSRRDVVSPTEWADRTFAAVDLGDRRRERRAVQLAAGLMRHPAALLPLQMGEASVLQAADRLLDEAAVRHPALCQPHWDATREQAGRQNLVVLIQDTTAVDDRHHPTTAGLGPLGNGAGRG